MVYKSYILPIGWLYATYHLLREPGNSIEHSPSNVFWRVYSFGQDPQNHTEPLICSDHQKMISNMFIISWIVGKASRRLCPQKPAAFDGLWMAVWGSKMWSFFDLLISVCIYIYNYYIKLNIDIIYICMYVACPKLFSQPKSSKTLLNFTNPEMGAALSTPKGGSW